MKRILGVNKRVRFFFKTVCFFSIQVPSILLSQENAHWETILQTGNSCTYFVPTSNISDSWKQTNFDDTDWTIGISGVGFADGDDNTIIPTGVNSVYLRFEFNVSDPANLHRLILDADYDDGFVAYLNGTEIARSNVPDPISWDQVLPRDHEATMYGGGLPERFMVIGNLSDSLLIPGLNILAIEVHNVSASSSDFSSNFYLHGLINSEDLLYSQVPDWFVEPVTFSGFNLPLMVINTNGQEILNEPKQTVDMVLINNSNGQLNKITDAPTDYNGKIGIEIRGESSQGFEQKSYSIELRNADGTNNNVKILGLPEESDFVLHGPYSDKTMMKNVLSFNLYNKMGHWAPRSRYFELIINEDYRGVYVLLEKIKRDKNRVNISKLDSTDISPEDISGGYILRRDKFTDVESYEYWTSPVQQIYYQQMEYQYYDPPYEGLTADQRTYIKNWFKNFDELMSGNNFAHPVTGYNSMVCVSSFADMLILNEFNKGIDNYQYSCYFYKSNDKEGGKLSAGPPWDYNIGFGNIDYGHNENIPYSYDWVYNHGGRTYWWNRLMEDPSFEDSVICSWNWKRNNVLSDNVIENTIDSCITVMGPAIDRHYQRYQILGKYVWPNAVYPDTYEEEVTNFKDWIFDRLAWMDGEWLGKCPVSSVENPEISEFQNGAVHFNVYPNPSDFSKLKIYIDTSGQTETLAIEIFDALGGLVESSNSQIFGTSTVINLPDLSSLANGIYFCKLYTSKGNLGTVKIIKQ